MAKKKTIWVLDEGSYSDYHVIGVFSSKENAAYIQNIVGGDYHEDELDPGVDALRKGYIRYNVVMLRDGTVERIERQNAISCYDIEDRNKFFLWQRTKAPAYAGKGIPDALQANIWAKNDKHAIKICNEYRTQMIANNEWVV
jgi:hypothetical protein